MKRSLSLFAVVFFTLSLFLTFSAMAQTVTLESLTTGDRIVGGAIKTFSLAPDGSLIVYLNGPLTWANLVPPIALDDAAGYSNCAVTKPASVVAQQNATLSFTVRSAGSTFTTGPVTTGIGCAPTACSTIVDPDPGATTFTSTSGSGFGVFTWNTNGLAQGSYLAVFEASNGGNKSQLPVMITITPHETISQPTVSGPSAGSIGQSLTFSASGSTSTPAGDQLQYYFDWGNGNSGWLPVGTTSASCSWAAVGNYSVKVQARSSTNTSVVSAWSSTYAVAITNTPPPASYTLTVNMSPPTGGGTVAISGYSNPATNLSGTQQLYISATPTTGSSYQFNSWTVGSGGAQIGSPGSASTTVTMNNADAVITANFSSTVQTSCTVLGDSCAQQFGSAVSLNFAECSNNLLRGYFGYQASNVSNCNSVEYNLPVGTTWFLVDSSQVQFSGSSLTIVVIDGAAGGGTLSASVYPIDSSNNLTAPPGYKRGITVPITTSMGNNQCSFNTLPAASIRYLVKLTATTVIPHLTIYYH